MTGEAIVRADAAWYRWPQTFGVLTADLHVAGNGGCRHGHVVFSRSEGAETSFGTEQMSPLQRAAVKDLMVVLGMFSGTDAAFGIDTGARYELVEAGSPLGRKYRAVDHPDELTVRLSHDLITEVGRRVGPNVVTHVVHDRISDEHGGTLATRFARVVRRHGGGLEAHQSLTVSVTQVGDEWVPTDVRVLTSDGEGTWLWQASLHDVRIESLPDVPADLIRRGFDGGAR